MLILIRLRPLNSIYPLTLLGYVFWLCARRQRFYLFRPMVPRVSGGLVRCCRMPHSLDRILQAAVQRMTLFAIRYRLQQVSS